MAPKHLREKSAMAQQTETARHSASDERHSAAAGNRDLRWSGWLAGVERQQAGTDGQHQVRE
jgi:hypothetical protein